MCDRDGCNARPEFLAVLVFRPDRERFKRVATSVKVCGFCKIKVTVDDIVLPPVWDATVDQLLSHMPAGALRPLRELTYIDWIGIKSKEARKAEQTQGFATIRYSEDDSSGKPVESTQDGEHGNVTEG